MDLRLERRRLPNGHVKTLEVIHHGGAAVIVPFLDNNRLVMIRQYRPVVDKYLWEFPAGKLDGRERPSDCARRELIEETGYRAGKFKRLGYIYPAAAYTTEKITVFKATRLKKAESAAEGDEIISVKILTKREIITLLRKGAFIDAKTIACLALCGII